MTEYDPIDFDPTTEEGLKDINEEVDNEYDTLLPRENETVDSLYSCFRLKFGRGWRDAFNRFSDLWKTRNPGRQLPEYMELQNMDEQTATLDRQRVESLISKYPDLDENEINITIGDKGNQLISFYSRRTNGWTKPERLHNENRSRRKSVMKN